MPSRYKSLERHNLKGKYPWIVYVVLTETLIKILPSILLLSLNFLMADRFYRVVEKRKLLQARQGRPAPSNLFPLQNRKYEDRRFTLELHMAITSMIRKGKNYFRFLYFEYTSEAKVLL